MPVAIVSSDKHDRHAAVGHSCVDYPITFFIASKAVNSGSVVAPRIIATSCVFFGQGHPLNRTETIYPDSEGYMPAEAITGPRLSIISRRSLLRGLLQALVSVKDIYRVGRAATCLHINVSSQYLDIVWNDWLPDWEVNGWPTREQEAALRGDKNRREGLISTRKSRSGSVASPLPRQRADSRASTRLSMISRADSNITSMTGDAQMIFDDDSDRLVNEDLLRKIAVFRRNFFKTTGPDTKGAAYVQLINYRHNPADRLAKESVSAASLDLTTQLPRPMSMISPSRITSRTGAASIISSSTDSIGSLGGRAAAGGRGKPSSIYSLSSPRKGTGLGLSSLQEAGESQPVAPPAPQAPQAKEVVTSPIMPPIRPVRSPRPAVAPASAPTPSPAPAPASAATAPAATAAAAPAIEMAAIARTDSAQKPVQKPRAPSRALTSDSGYDTEQDDFADARSTFSFDKKEPESALAKMVSIPTAVVAATVAAVLAPAPEVKTKATEPPANRRGSFAVETEQALAAVKVPAIPPSRPVVVPKRTSSYGKPKSNAVQNDVTDGVQRKPSVNERRSVQMEREQSSKKRRSGEAPRRASVTTTTRKSGEMTRESSRMSKKSTRSRSNTGLSLAESNKLARQISARSTTKGPVILEKQTSRPAIESNGASAAAPAIKRGPVDTPPAAPKQRSSFFSLRGMNNKKSDGYFKTNNKASEPYLPPMDRLIDYRPPQSRNLRTAKPSGNQEEPITSPSISSPIEEDSKPLENGKSQTVGRSGPFGFLKKRASAR